MEEEADDATSSRNSFAAKDSVEVKLSADGGAPEGKNEADETLLPR